MEVDEGLKGFCLNNNGCLGVVRVPIILSLIFLVFCVAMTVFPFFLEDEQRLVSAGGLTNVEMFRWLLLALEQFSLQQPSPSDLIGSPRPKDLLLWTV